MQILTKLHRGSIHSKVIGGKRTFLPVDKDDCILYLPMESRVGDIIYDESGNGNNGIVYTATDIDGKIGKALSFDGANDWVDCGNAAGGDYNALTISTWFKRTSDSSAHSNGWRTALHRNNSYAVGTSVFFIGLTGATTHQIISTIGAGFGASGGLSSGLTGVNSIINTWYYVVGAWDGTTARTYVDGVEKVTYSLTGSITKVGAKTVVGTSFNATGYQFPCVIDEVRIYNRALGSEEILATFNREK